ncbi:MAG: GGDEF domain-containing protein [Magnetococcales bacterium]|nr:GGDEF domain-containing protein [Magnetococcales bacterium]
MIVNPSAEKVLGKSEKNIIDSGFLQIFDDINTVQSLIHNEKKNNTKTIQYQDKVLRCFFSNSTDDSGENIGSILFIRDITKNRRRHDRLRSMSYSDNLTGLYNTRWMDEILFKEYKRTKRQNLELTVICFKPVEFENLCKNYGKNMGNKVLISMGSAVRSVFRETDHCCRIGHDIFCSILLDTPSNKAYQVANRFDDVFHPPQDEIALSFQFGIASFTENKTQNHEELVELAKVALEKAGESEQDHIVIVKD